MPATALVAAGVAKQSASEPRRRDELARQQQLDNVSQNMCRGRKGPSLPPRFALDARLTAGFEREDARVKRLAEDILYTFLPIALHVVAGGSADAAALLTPERGRAVACAVLSVAVLLNAPPGFVEFLLCIPWATLSQLYYRPENVEDLLPALHVADDERHCLANQRLQQDLLPAMLDFLYQPRHVTSLPPMLVLTDSTAEGNLQQEAGSTVPPVTRDTIAALLDGATPLHCAAIRGNPAQVDHLLFCGADAMARTAAGQLPLELVPACGEGLLGGAGLGRGACRCMGSRDAELWQCRSGLARTLLARRCLLWFREGLVAWARMAVVCILCIIGVWGFSASMHRMVLEKHEARRAQERRATRRAQAFATLASMRGEAAAGAAHLAQARARAAELAAAPDVLDPGEGGGWRFSYIDSLMRGHLDAAPLYIFESGREHLATGSARTRWPGAEDADRAYECFGRALEHLQSLELRGGTLPAGFVDTGDPAADDCRGGVVAEEEQAALYSCWAEAVLLKFRDCACAGCAALAVQAIRLAHAAAARLFARMDKRRARAPEAWRAVGRSLARVVAAHVALLLHTEARQSATRAAVWRAQHCLQEWSRMMRLGLTVEDDDNGAAEAACLEAWAAAAEGDLLLGEALVGLPLAPNQALADVLPSAMVYDVRGNAFLNRPVSRETAQQLETTLAVATAASPRLAALVASAARNAAAEIAAADELREIMSVKSGSGGVANAVDALCRAIDAASRFPRLQAEVKAARALRDRWTKRAEAVAALEAVMEDVRAAAGATLPDDPSERAAFWQAWRARVHRLEAAVEDARAANISVNRAKRLLKELQAQAAAAEAAEALQAVLAAKPAGSAQLKAAVSKAEAAASAAGSSGAGLAIGAQLLAPALAAARQQLEVERAAENLARTAGAARGVADLPKLEAAILSARKVGAEALHPDAYRSASELRATLDSAARARGTLEATLRSLQRPGAGDEEAAAVHAALNEATACGNLLAPDVERAQETLARWRAALANEGKLAHALAGGAANSVALARAIQEAAAAGVRVADAKRILKLMQALEAAVTMAPDSGGYAALQAKIEAAEAGGMQAAGLLATAKAQARRLLAMEVKGELESALRARGSERSAGARAAALRAALDRSAMLLGQDATGSAHESGLSASPASSEAAGSGAGGSEDDTADSSRTKEAVETGPPSPHVAFEQIPEDEEVAAVRRLAAEAHAAVEAEAAAAAAAEAERNEELRARREKQRRERAERERALKERAERDKAERERAERERAERREREARDREVALREAGVRAEKARRERALLERMAREREERRDRELPLTPLPRSAATVGMRRRGQVGHSELQLSGEALQMLNSAAEVGNEHDSVSDRHSEAGSGEVAGGALAARSTAAGYSRSASLRSSAASTEDVVYAEAAVAAQAGEERRRALTARGASSTELPAVVSAADFIAGGLWAPALVERSAGSAPRLKYADLGGAAWGMERSLTPNPSSSSGGAPPAFHGLPNQAHQPFHALPADLLLPARAEAPTWRAVGTLGEGNMGTCLSVAPAQGALSASVPSLGLFAEDDAGSSQLPGDSSWLAGTSPHLPSDADVLAAAAGDSSLALAGFRTDLPKTLRVQRPCRYHLAGMCRDGARCRFAHTLTAALPPSTAPLVSGMAAATAFSGSQLTQAQQAYYSSVAQQPVAPAPFRQPTTSAMLLAGNFAYGAPGSAAFSRAPAQLGAASTFTTPSSHAGAGGVHLDAAALRGSFDLPRQAQQTSAGVLAESAAAVAAAAAAAASPFPGMAHLGSSRLAGLDLASSVPLGSTVGGTGAPAPQSHGNEGSGWASALL